MPNYGISWDGDVGKLSAEGLPGFADAQVIDGIHPNVAMALAIMLARGARSRGAAWPSAVYEDPWERGAIRGLQTQAGERGAQPDESVPAGPDITVLTQALGDLRALSRQVDRAVRAMEDEIGTA